MSTRIWNRTMLIGGLAAAAACSDVTATQTVASALGSASATTVTEPETGPWARIIEGSTGPGALYSVYVPRTWNGDAISYAHGFRDSETPVDLRDQDQFYATRDALGAMGYAFAYSSYSENGFAVKDGAQRTHQLRGATAAALGAQPERNFLIGHSLGGGIGLALAESYPDQYSGALLVCGMVGGTLVQTQYLGHTRALFDAFFPGAIPGDVLGVPAGTNVTIPQVVAAVQSNPAALFAIASTQQTPLPFVPAGNPTDPSSVAFQTLVGSLFGALSFHARGINNVVDLTNGASVFDNATTTYTLGTPILPPAVLQPLVTFANGAVTRYTMDPSASKYLDRHFTPTGDLRVPVLTVHNAWDPAVPLFHEAELRARVQAAGMEGNLLQRTVPSFGHCNVSSAQTVQSFTDLAGWVSTGSKPAN
jgi:pimeloyl-ACP methyl ester carboxylesterase